MGEMGEKHVSGRTEKVLPVAGDGGESSTMAGVWGSVLRAGRYEEIGEAETRAILRTLTSVGRSV